MFNLFVIVTNVIMIGTIVAATYYNVRHFRSLHKRVDLLREEMIDRIREETANRSRESARVKSAVVILARLVELHQNGVNVSIYSVIKNVLPEVELTEERLYMNDEDFNAGIEELLNEDNE